MQPIQLHYPIDGNYFVNEAFNTLSTNIRFSGPDVKVITLTSCYENEGKSSVVLQLAKHLCIDGKRVLVIDADMRKSVMIARFTDLNQASGLSELISGMAPLESVIYHAEGANLDLMFCGALPPNPVALLSHAAFRELLASLRSSYDYILIDTPPLNPVIDAALTATVSDGIVLVINRGCVRKKALISVVEQLAKSGTPILGTVVNDTRRNIRKKGARILSGLFRRGSAAKK